MKKYLLAAGVFVLSITYLTPLAAAHVLVTDGSIGAVMHVNPDDDPVAGQGSSLFFEFTDKQNQFKPQDCDCNITISQASGGSPYSQPLFQTASQSDPNSTVVQYTFPKTGAYQIALTGKPRSGNNFQTFTLNYVLRVNRGAQADQQKKSSNLVPILGMIALFAGFIGFVIWQLKRRAKAPAKTTKNDNEEVY